MATQEVTPQLFVGIDIAAASFTVAAQDQSKIRLEATTYDQDDAGFAALHKRLSSLGLPPAAIMVVMEATSTYWMALAVALHTWNYHVSVVNPKQAHDFAAAIRQHGKTDPKDARMLARLGALLTPPRWNPPPAIYHQWQQRLAQRDSLLDMRQALRNQQHALAVVPVAVAPVQQRQQALLDLLNAQIREIARELQALSKQDDEWSRSIVRLQSIPGVGLLTAAVLVVGTLNFTSCENAQAASAMAGLAPVPHQSGTSVKGRGHIGHRGNGRLRRALYMSSLSAARYNPPLKAFYERLKAAGKPGKLSRCAVARKLLELAYTLVTKRRLFDPEYGKPNPVAATP